jgi:hypothetical protein
MLQQADRLIRNPEYVSSRRSSKFAFFQMVVWCLVWSCGERKARERGIIRVWTLIDIDIVVEPRIRVRQTMKLEGRGIFEAFEV